MKYPADWIVPEWPKPANVNALITTRNGGVSRGPFTSFNLGSNVGDDPRLVASNHTRLRRLLPQEPKWLRQEHGSNVVYADALDHIPEADASVARNPGTVCAIAIADCLPVLLCDCGGTRVAAVHGGWRSLSKGIIEKTVREIGNDGVGSDELLAYLGPAIGPCAFEVGHEVYDAFLRNDPQNVSAFRSCNSGKWLADLFAIARRALERTGVTRIFGGGLCTYSAPERFYSYRRDNTTGRMAALVWRDR